MRACDLIGESGCILTACTAKESDHGLWQFTRAFTTCSLTNTQLHRRGGPGFKPACEHAIKTTVVATATTVVLIILIRNSSINNHSSSDNYNNNGNDNGDN